MANSLTVELHALGVETASADGSSVDVSALRRMLRLSLDVTAVAGTNPKLTVYVETRRNSSGAWRQLGAFQPVTAAQSVPLKTFGTCDQYVRARWTIEGTNSPSFTFAVTGAAHVLYAEPADITSTQMQPGALENVENTIQLECCLAATDEADGYIGGGYTLPLAAWGADLRMHVAALALYRVMHRRGFKPEGVDELIVKNKDDAIGWLNRVAAGRIVPIGIVDSTPETFDGGAYLSSEPRRGW